MLIKLEVTRNVQQLLACFRTGRKGKCLYLGREEVRTSRRKTSTSDFITCYELQILWWDRRGK